MCVFSFRKKNVQLAARIAVSNLHKCTLDSFSETMEELYTYVNPKNNEKSPLLSDETHAAIVKNREVGLYNQLASSTKHLNSKV